MKLTAKELARLDAVASAVPVPPALPGLGDEPATIATLKAYRQRRLAGR